MRLEDGSIRSPGTKNVSNKERPIKEADVKIVLYKLLVNRPELDSGT
jgi:hypothetical protein